MKKLIIGATVALAAGAYAATNTVTSANIVGYNKVEKPADKLTIVAAQFNNTSLDELFTPGNFVADLDDTLADRILSWNGSNYVTYALCDPSLLGQGDTPQWRTIGANFFTPQTNYVNTGDGLWLQSRASSTNTMAIMSGEVPTVEYITNNITDVLTLMSYPFTSDIDLNTTLTNGTANLDDTLCDRILVWDTDIQNYVTYGLCDPTALGQGSDPQWRPIGAAFFAPNPTLIIPMGQGFWYQSEAPFEWAARSTYFENL